MYHRFMKLLAITTVAVCTSLLFTAGEAYAGHSCPQDTTVECCDACTLVCADFCLSAAQAAFDECVVTFPDPFLHELICDPALTADVANCLAHSGGFGFTTCVDTCVTEVGAVECEETGPDCVANAAATKVQCKQSCPSGNAGKDCRRACQNTFLDAVFACIQ